jgi:hypothetical protein
MDARACANGLGWFSIALGLAELVAAKPLGRALGIKSTSLIRAFGVRELMSGIGVLTQRRKGPWILGRIAGDVLDVAVLGAALSPRNRQRGNAALAMAAVSPVVVLDLICGRRLGLRA